MLAHKIAVASSAFELICLPKNLLNNESQSLTRIDATSTITVAILNPILKKMRKRLNTTVYYDDPTLHRVIYTRYNKRCNRIEKARNIIRDKLITINHYIMLILAIIQFIIYAI